MDFVKIKTRNPRKNEIEVYSDFQIIESKDIMFRGKSFYAIWDQERGLWSTNEFDVQRLVDTELEKYASQINSRDFDGGVHVRAMHDFSSNTWTQYKKLCSTIADTAHDLDANLTFQNTKTTKGDYSSKRLPYSLEEGPIEAWDHLVGTLFDPLERQKIEWAIGAVVSGESKYIQKFIVLYGEGGTGKSTILNIIQKLFAGYYIVFEAKALGSANNSFAAEAFKRNPLVAIEHDGDLSKIEDNTKLNSIIAHEEMIINEKFKAPYAAKANALLFIGTNKPVKITDGKSGLIRRLIDIRSSGRTLDPNDYHSTMSQIDFELGAIASHCLKVYRELGKNYYKDYLPKGMILETNVFYNFVESLYYIFSKDNVTSLARAWDMYKEFCTEWKIDYPIPRYRFREELKTYFAEYHERKRVDGKELRGVYLGFQAWKFDGKEPTVTPPYSLTLDSEESIFDTECADCPAQYAVGETQLPGKKWINVSTTLKDLDTTQLHYVKVPNNHIVIDFDLTDDTGEKSAQLNLEAASNWPKTYAEFSKSHKGVHLHYIYDGDPDKLKRIYDKGIEIKVFNGDASLRRMRTKSNNIPIAHLSSGLPLKGEKVINTEAVKTEQGLRNLVTRNLNKEILGYTAPSIDFIKKILDDAYNTGIRYDLTNMRPSVLAFAMKSTNQADRCVKVVSQMKFQSKEEEPQPVEEEYADERIVFFDVEVFPNLFVVCWKYKGADHKMVNMINPSSEDIENLMKMKLVGFNNRRYDNHILYARYLGYNNEDLFKVSSRITSNSQNGYFREAYEISYTDIYDFASAANKKSLKKWEIELGIHHQELGIPWDQPVPEELWSKVVEYCGNDVIASEVVFDHLSGDWAARKVIAELSGLSVNRTTNQHSTRIIFGDVKDTRNDLVYTDLSEMFPGYTYDAGKSMYRGVEVGEGGYVYAEPGIYENVALLDVASMHPTSIEQLNLFGKYTKRYSDLKQGRVAIKRNNREALQTLLDGKLVPYLKRADDGEFKLSDLSNGLKTVLNSAYGLTYAHHDNPFKDPRNIDNIVAKRGALFMVDLQYALQERGYKVVHIKTDSVKIADASQEAIDFVFEFGKQYGYEFEHEATYSKFCLVNDAVYIAKYKDGKKAGQWTATGAEFAQPYVFKALFTKEEITFSDLCEDKSVTADSALYLDFNETLEEGEHNYQFVGKVGLFCPVEEGAGGGLLMRKKEDKYYAATGTKGYRWMEAEVVKDLDLYDKIDLSYHEGLAAKAIEHISKFGDYDKFISE